MKFIVTGGSGFLGSHLCRKLLNEGNQIICIDNFYSSSKKNISDLINNPNFNLINHNIINHIDLKCDGIYNLACPASPKKYQKDPIYTIDTSFFGIKNMLNLANKLKVRILHTSTSEIYGDPKIHPQNESYFGNVNPVGPRSCYDEGKRIAETLCYEYNKQYKLDVRLCRIFNTYGPSMLEDDGRVISNFIVSALKNKSLKVYGDGSQTRSFCYVSDMIDGIVKLFTTEKKEDSINMPFNLGNPDEYNILDIAEKIIKMTNSCSKIEFEELPINDPIKRKPEISKALKTLKWSPTVSLEEGLKKTISYFNNI